MTAKKSPGAPTKWQDDNIERLYKAAKRQKDQPWTNKQIAYIFGIVPSTLHKWIDEKPGLRECIDEIRSRADDVIENEFYKNCIGYYKTETKTTKDAVGNVIRTETTNKWYPPSHAAQYAWLRHRRPKEWSDAVLENADTDTLDGLIASLSRARAKMGQENT